MDSTMVPPAPRLMDMPLFIKEQIVQSLGPATRIAVRTCSKDFRKSAANARILHWRVFLRKSRHYDSICFKSRDEEHELMYSPRAEGGCVLQITTRTTTRREQRTKVFENGLTYEEMAMNEIQRLLRRNIMYLELLDIKSNEPLFFEQVGQLLGSLRYQLPVKLLILAAPVGRQEDVMCILPQLKPKILKYVWINFHAEMVYDQIVETSQFKEAESFKSTTVCDIPFDKLQHFKELQVGFSNFSLQDCKKFMALANSYGRSFSEYEIFAKKSKLKAIKRFLSPFKRNNAPDIEPNYIVSFRDTENNLAMTLSPSFDDDDCYTFTIAQVLGPWRCANQFRENPIYFEQLP